MTDNRTTELRRKLIERHVSFECSEEGNYRRTSWITNGVQWNYREFDGNTSLGMGNVWKDCSPEQAIAATLGRERETKLMLLIAGDD